MRVPELLGYPFSLARRTLRVTQMARLIYTRASDNLPTTDAASKRRRGAITNTRNLAEGRTLILLLTHDLAPSVNSKQYNLHRKQVPSMGYTYTHRHTRPSAP
jgi:hypothetical protein